MEISLLAWPFMEGFFLGAALLIALGPKDVFVIKSSLQGHSALMLIAICFLADVFLISLGVLGLGTIVTSSQSLMVIAMVVSIAYLLYFSVRAVQAAFRGPTHVPGTSGCAQSKDAKAQAVKTALFHSLLTPYAWLDTVLVIGALSALKPGQSKFAFAGGVMTASLLWFIFLAMGSRMAAPLFRNRRAWQALDLIVAGAMLVLAIKLAADYPWS